MPRHRPGWGNKGRFVLITAGHLAKERWIYASVPIILDGLVPDHLDKKPRRAVKDLVVRDQAIQYYGFIILRNLFF